MPKRGVRHRIDGLEINGIWYFGMIDVRHRIDGLENLSVPR